MNRKILSLILFSFLAHVDADVIQIVFHNGGVTVGALGTEPDGTRFASSTDTINNVQNNGGVGLSFSGFALSDTSGSATGASLALSTGFAGFNNNGWGGQNDDWVAMEGWYGFREAESLTISNLPAAFTSQGYTVTVYGDSDVASRTMNYTIGGTTQTIIDAGTFSGTFTEGSNYTVFSGLSGSSFTLSGNDVATPGRSAINAIEITSIPEPGSLVLFLMAMGYFGLKSRRSR